DDCGMKILKTLTLLCLWIVPLLAFPSSLDGIANGHGFAKFNRACYAPLPLVFLYSEPAAFFTRERGATILSPHWKYWFYALGVAAVSTAYAVRRRETQLSSLP